MGPSITTTGTPTGYAQLDPGRWRVVMEKTLLTKVINIAFAIAFSLVLCAIAVRPALADDHGRGRGHEKHYEGRDHDWDRGGSFYVAPRQDYYYTPQPNYYYAPEPDYYYAPQPEYYPPRRSDGISLFFGL